MKKYTKRARNKNYEIEDDIDLFLYKFLTGED